MFAGSMESISKDLFEAAQIDGANRWQQFIHIILPAIKNIIYLNLILAVNGALQVYEIPMIMRMAISMASSARKPTTIAPPI